MLMNQIRKLIKLVEESEIDELEVTRWGSRIRIRKNPISVKSAPVSVEVEPAVGASSRNPLGAGLNPSPAPVEPDREQEAIASPNAYMVKAPMVGTFYRSPSPESTPFVEVGSKVTIGQTLCIIEAMKLMNELPSEVNGVISKILVENSEPIEYGQELFLIET
jgi:acetyl-CoA carboxylase biotin carboxyl carrier protein